MQTQQKLLDTRQFSDRLFRVYISSFWYTVQSKEVRRCYSISLRKPAKRFISASFYFFATTPSLSFFAFAFSHTVINILGVVILFAAVIGTIGAFYRERKTIHIIYLVVVLIAFVFQIITAVVVYQLTANARIWLSKIWSEETKEYREYAQTKFSCCGFANPLDHPVATSSCSATDSKNSFPPCFDPLVKFIAHELAIVYIILFSAISIEMLAVCNSITLLCTRMIYSTDAISLHKLKKSSATLVDSAIDPSSASYDVKTPYHYYEYTK
ncbi:hypothetical protein [Absidia glauca]|uniref:Tetraspanin n=1 Tax=Absidia glauca TaxID=4829 RepID=A0A168R5Z2_ABSGL|nr:hypothetical protein [Absidia glauca]